MIERVGSIMFDKMELDVYSSMSEPLFVAWDVAATLGYDDVPKMTEHLETGEYFKLRINDKDLGVTTATMLTESGLYNAMSQSRVISARKWRKLIHEELIRIRKESGKTIGQQFDEWDAMLDDLYFDEEKGMMMQSVTTQSGDVVQMPYNREAN